MMQSPLKPQCCILLLQANKISQARQLVGLLFLVLEAETCQAQTQAYLVSGDFYSLAQRWRLPSGPSHAARDKSDSQTSAEGRSPVEGLPHLPLCDLGFQCRRLLATLRQRSQVTLQRCHTSVQSYENMSGCPRAEMGDSLTTLNRSMESPSLKATEKQWGKAWVDH